jgi:DNA-binding transcriptional regulator LsrR (DeoR family)
VELDRQTKVLVAKDYFTVPKLSNKELAARYAAQGYKIKARDIRDIVDECIRSNWVGIVINSMPDEKLETDIPLGARLARALDIEHAIVVTVRKPAPRGAYTTPFALYSDHVHFLLGKAMAQTIPNWIERGDRIGLSSGRGVRYSINALQASLNAGDVTLVSLTGGLEMRAHAQHSVIMDGDLNVAALAARFGQPVHVQMAACEIADPDAKPWFKEPGAKMPTKALVGIGVLEGRNRFCRQPKPNKQLRDGTNSDIQSLKKGAQVATFPRDFLERQPPLGKLQTHLDELEAFVRSAKERHEIDTIGEVANYPFYVGPPDDAGTTPPSPARTDIEGTLDELGASLKCTTLAQLSQVKLLYVIAGTEQKAPAILAAMRILRHKVHTLVTDSLAAEYLIRHASASSVKPANAVTP